MRLVRLAGVCFVGCSAAAPLDPAVPEIEVEVVDESTPPEPDEPSPVAANVSPEDTSVGEGSSCRTQTKLRRWNDMKVTAATQLDTDLAFVAFGCRDLAGTQTYQLTLTLEPGACYAFLAQGEGEVDLRLALDFQKTSSASAMPPGLFPSGLVLAVDDDAGPTAIIGEGQGACFKNPLPLAMPAAIEVVGAGPIAVGVYKK